MVKAVLIDDEWMRAPELYQQLRSLVVDEQVDLELLVLVPTVKSVRFPTTNGVAYRAIPWCYRSDYYPDMQVFVNSVVSELQQHKHEIAVVVLDFILYDIKPLTVYWNNGPEGTGLTAAQETQQRLWGAIQLRQEQAQEDWFWMLRTRIPQQAAGMGFAILDSGVNVVDCAEARHIGAKLLAKAKANGDRLRDQLIAFAALRAHKFHLGSYCDQCKDREGSGLRDCGPVNHCTHPECASVVEGESHASVEQVNHADTQCCPAHPQQDINFHHLPGNGRFVCACRVCIEHIRPALARLSHINGILPNCMQSENNVCAFGSQGVPNSDSWERFLRSILLTYNPYWAVLEGIIGQQLDAPLKKHTCPLCQTTWWKGMAAFPSETGHRTFGKNMEIEWHINKVYVGGEVAKYGLAHPDHMNTVGRVLRGNLIDGRGSTSLKIATHQVGECYRLRASYAPRRAYQDLPIDAWNDARCANPNVGDKVSQIIWNAHAHGGSVVIWNGQQQVWPNNTALGSQIGAGQKELTCAELDEDSFTIDVCLPVITHVDAAFWARQNEGNNAR